jgi:2,3-bisphosphoglycerate-independent phosphoglycerate mutase
MSANTRKALLVILDGWGHGPDPDASAIAQANTPFTDSLYKDWPNAELRTDGEFVGLPEGQMGNSEVGHLNIGAGRVVYQELLRIHKAIESGELAGNTVLQEAFAQAREGNRKLHLLGLVSDGGVHSHIGHLKGLLDLVADAGLSERCFVHAFTDGRDTDPHGGEGYLQDLLGHMQGSGARLASIVGRYFAMDRDKRWPRIRKAYDLLVHGKGKASTDALEALRASYAEGTTDEFIEPIVLTDAEGQALAPIAEGDVVLFFNFRTDRCRQIVTALSQEAFPEEDMKPLDLHLVTMSQYDKQFQNVQVLLHKENIAMTMGETLEKVGCSQIRIAETEKYPHVTFFFSGGRETEFRNERRILVPSPKVATYDMQPEMSAPGLRDALVPELRNGTADFVVLNFANADMVGHTGSMDAAIQAVETVDACLKDVVEAALEGEYAMLVTADHGNADKMRNADGSPNTAHTTNPVPVWLIDPQRKDAVLNKGKLADLAPTLLYLMGLEVPPEMTGDNLVQNAQA